MYIIIVLKSVARTGLGLVPRPITLDHDHLFKSNFTYTIIQVRYVLFTDFEPHDVIRPIQWITLFTERAFVHSFHWPFDSLRVAYIACSVYIETVLLVSVYITPDRKASVFSGLYNVIRI